LTLVLEPFEWDEANIAHLARHGITPQEAEEVLSNHPLFVRVDLRGDELRRCEFGATRSGRILVVITTARAYKIRVITSWPADRALRAVWASR
jgi:hypothetical protein